VNHARQHPEPTDVTTAPTPAARRARPRRGGFTLLECALAMVILGVGVLAVIEAQSAFFRANEFSSLAAQGGYLAGEVRERMRGLTKHDPVTGLFLQSGAAVGWGPETGETMEADFDDIDDYNGAIFGGSATGARPGPIDARGQIILQVDFDGNIEMNGAAQVALRNWIQTVEVVKVEPTNSATTRAPNYERLTANSDGPAVRVDQLSMRVTVIVTYQGMDDATPREMARLSWLVP